MSDPMNTFHSVKTIGPVRLEPLADGRYMLHIDGRQGIPEKTLLAMYGDWVSSFSQQPDLQPVDLLPAFTQFLAARDIALTKQQMSVAELLFSAAAANLPLRGFLTLPATGTTFLFETLDQFLSDQKRSHS